MRRVKLPRFQRQQPRAAAVAVHQGEQIQTQKTQTRRLTTTSGGTTTTGGGGGGGGRGVLAFFWSRISSMPEGERSTGTAHLVRLPCSEHRTSSLRSSYSNKRSVSLSFLVRTGKRAFNADSAMGSSTKRWTARRMGLAPKRMSVADSRMAVLRVSPMLRALRNSPSARSATVSRLRSRMSSRSSPVRASKMTISSRRFRNSGRNFSDKALPTFERRVSSLSSAARISDEPTFVV
mmetsp:Transcript_38609/g.123754  ORF Transcript_38609/g.123754 Transcript_38609/m.123754 type:complete len:235 (-) Transcript_38609:2078-2782(-)